MFNKNNKNIDHTSKAVLNGWVLICYIYLRIENVEGYVLIAVYLFIYLFVCVLLA